MSTPKAIRTRGSLLDAALECFSEIGYSAASVQDVVQYSRFTKPTFYYYFRSKTESYSALVDRVQRELLGVLRKALSAEGDLKTRLAGIIMVMASQAQGKKKKCNVRLAYSVLYTSEKEIPERKERLATAREFQKDMAEFFKSRIDKGELVTKYSPEALAQQFYGVASAAVTRQLTDESYEVTEDCAATIVEMFLSGAGNK